MTRPDEGLGAAAWLVACVAATVLLLVIWGLSALLHPGVWLWLLEAGPMTPLALLALGLLLTGVPR